MKLKFGIEPYRVPDNGDGSGSGVFFRSPDIAAPVVKLVEVHGEPGITEDGTGDADYIEGTDGDDILRGYAGEDYLRSYDGDDQLYGGDDDDYLLSEGGSNILYGGAGNDSLIAADDADARPSSFSDQLYGEDGDDTLNGYGGDDFLDGGAGSDALIGGRGNDVLTGGADADTFYFNRETIKVSTDTVPVYVPVGMGDDIITDFDPAEDVIDLSGLRSRSLGQAVFASAVQSGANVILTVTGDSPGTITLQNTDLGDLSEANFVFFPLVLQDDHVTAPATGPLTANVLDDNGNGADTSYGAPIQGMYGTVNLATGETNYPGGTFDIGEGARLGIDYDGSVIFTPNGALDYLREGESLTFAIQYTIGTTEGTRDTATLYLTLTGQANDTAFQDGDSGDNALTGGTEDDTLSGFGGSDTLDGATGNDRLFGGEGNDTLSGGAGRDRLWGDAGDDDLSGGAGPDSMLGGDGNDTLSGGTSFDKLLGGTGDDTLNGDDGNDVLSGYDGNDLLYGGDGDDVLDGGRGNDEIHGGNGSDTMTGGAGFDVFYIRNGENQVITDFDPTEDHIVLDAMYLFYTWEELTLVQSGKDVILTPIEDSGYFSLTLRNMTLEALQDGMISYELLLGQGETAAKAGAAVFEPALPAPPETSLPDDLPSGPAHPVDFDAPGPVLDLFPPDADGWHFF